MPELPEIESLCRQLNAGFGGLVIKSVCRPRTPFLVQKPIIDLVGMKIIAFLRHGKYVTIRISDRTRLLIHFGMSGRLVARPPSRKHDHFGFEFSTGDWLTFNDFRRFGRVWRVAERHLLQKPPLSILGPDALSKAFNSKTLDIRSQRSVKSLLLNQHIVAGLGNIYSSESLYHAGIRPTRTASSLSQAERKMLAKQIKGTLRAAIKRGGSTLNDYRRTEGQSGDYDRYFAVFAREGRSCPKCDCQNGVKRIVQQGRSTFFCPIKQH